MRRIWRIAPLLLLGVAFSFGQSQYIYYSENLAAPNWSNWLVTQQLYQSPGVMTVYNYSGGYSGIGAGSNGAMLGTAAGLYGGGTGEVNMTIRLDPTYPTGAYTAYIAADSDLGSFYEAVIQPVN